jgi:hypothetical protein
VGESLHSRLVLRAADIKGGPGALAQALDVSLAAVQAWMRAAAPLPPWVFFALVDIIYEEQLRDIEHERSASEGATRQPARN